MTKLHHTEYNAIVQKIHNKQDWFKPFMALVREYYEDYPSGGSLHIVLDDGNLRDGHLHFCEGYACGAEDGIGAQIASLMLNLSMTQRNKVYKSVHAR